MTRTAILYSGSAYNTKFSLPSALKNLIEPNNADVFIVTDRRCLRRKTVASVIPDPDLDWQKFLEKNNRQVNDLSTPLQDEEVLHIKEVFGERLKSFNLIEDMQEYSGYLNEERAKMMHTCNEYRRESINRGIKPPFNEIEHPANGNILCVVDQFRHIRKCYELMCEYENEHGFKYDYVMRARIDFIVPEKISVEHYTLNHDKAYWYIMGSVLRDPFPFAEEFCWFSKRSIADQIYPALDRMGLITDRKYDTYYEPQNNDFRFAAEAQFALLIKELGLPWINVKIYRSAQYTSGGDGWDYMNYRFKRNIINLEEEYQLCCKCESDINEHLPKLREYAAKSDHITEFGTRYGNSTVAFMSAYPKKFISYDVTPNDRIEYLGWMAKDAGVNFEFRHENVEQIEIEETDLLFIDTNHHQEQCSNELKLHSDKARKYIIFHDTVTFWEDGQGYWKGEGHGLRYAIEPFLENHPEWQIDYRATNNNGLMILKRITVE